MLGQSMRGESVSRLGSKCGLLDQTEQAVKPVAISSR